MRLCARGRRRDALRPAECARAVRARGGDALPVAAARDHAHAAAAALRRRRRSVLAGAVWPVAAAVAALARRPSVPLAAAALARGRRYARRRVHRPRRVRRRDRRLRPALRGARGHVRRAGAPAVRGRARLARHVGGRRGGGVADPAGLPAADRAGEPAAAVAADPQLGGGGARALLQPLPRAALHRVPAARPLRGRGPVRRAGRRRERRLADRRPDHPLHQGQGAPSPTALAAHTSPPPG